MGLEMTTDIFEDMSDEQLGAVLDVLWLLYDNDINLYEKFREVLDIAENKARERSIIE
jgi:hypothetical protein